MLVDEKTEALLEILGLEELISCCIDLSAETMDKLKEIWNDPNVPEEVQLLLSDLYFSKLATRMSPDVLGRLVKRERDERLTLALRKLLDGSINFDPETACDLETHEIIKGAIADEGQNSEFRAAIADVYRAQTERG